MGRSGASISSIQNAAIIARVQAIASRRARVTSASYVGDRSRTTLEHASYSANTSISRVRNARLCRFGRDDMCARIKAPIKVNSGEGGGMSSLNDGGIPLHSIAHTPTEHTPPRASFIERRNIGDCKAGTARAAVYSTGNMINDQRPACPPAESAVGRADWVNPFPASRPAVPYPHGRTAGLKPAASLCRLSVSRRHPSQGIGANLVRLLEGCGAATPRGFFKPVEATVNHLPATEINGDDLGHSSSVLLSCPALEAS